MPLRRIVVDVSGFNIYLSFKSATDNAYLAIDKVYSNCKTITQLSKDNVSLN